MSEYDVPYFKEIVCPYCGNPHAEFTSDGPNRMGTLYCKICDDSEGVGCTFTAFA